MFDIAYDCTFIMFRPVNEGVHLRTHIYTFKANNHHAYIVEFDEFVGNLMLVKFYQKNHSESPNKYNLLTNSGWACSVMYTVFNLMFKIWKEQPNENISFGFMGSNIIKNDGSSENRNTTKRFKFYRKMIATFMGTENFMFKQNTDSSIFVMINKKNQHVTHCMDEILKYIYINYSILDIDLILEPFSFKGQSG